MVAGHQLVGAAADHRRHVAGADEGVEAHAGRLEDRPDGGDDGDVVAENGEVSGAELARPHQGEGGRRRRGLEADGEEDDLAVGIPARQLQGVERRVDHAHVGAARLVLERAAAPARHPHHVAEGGEDHRRVLGERQPLVDARHRQHAHRTARPVYELEIGPIAHLEPLVAQEVDVDPPPHAGDVDEGHGSVVEVQLRDFAGDRETHDGLLSPASILGNRPARQNTRKGGSRPPFRGGPPAGLGVSAAATRPGDTIRRCLHTRRGSTGPR